MYALNKLANDNPNMKNNIAGVAILDIELADQDDPSTINIEISDADGEQFMESYEKKVFFGRSASYEGVPYPGDDSNVNNYSQLNHETIATSGNVAQDIAVFFGWER